MRGSLRDEARKVQREASAVPHHVNVLGRQLAVVEDKGGIRALEKDKTASPKAAASYVERAFGANLAAVRAAMEDLAGSLDPEELNRVGFRLYDVFRPEVPAGTKGWGAKGVLDLKRIQDAARAS